ncbi:MAG TPA: bifunctional histidinol-phosphatase/imidazoleglycerol-phosphate dehydratase HisB [Steroidobacteraceae bacterium]|nr:bifunctional histidinol-phosphatase/imidazoleglycerol-phosphate dehydratase HisB [Steroidobacteraceae bacterium]
MTGNAPRPGGEAAHEPTHAGLAAPVLFLDHDGTLVEEPPDRQVDSIAKVRFMPGVFAALAELAKAGFRMVIVTNQDGLGTASHPTAAFEKAHRFILDAFESQGIVFEAVLICPHFPGDGCECRKPATGLVQRYRDDPAIDLSRSAVVGDRDTDLELARNLGVRGLRVRRDGTPEETWPAVARALLSRRARLERVTRETRVAVAVDLEGGEPVRARTGIGFFDHMLEQLAKHGGFALELTCEGDLHVDEHHTVEDCALALGEAWRRALGNKAGIARYGFLLPMDESRAQVALDLSGRAYAVFEGRFARERIGDLPTELVPHFFRSLAESLGAAIHVSVSGENCHHMVEACFKGVGRALRAAARREGVELPTTKGVL